MSPLGQPMSVIAKAIADRQSEIERLQAEIRCWTRAHRRLSRIRHFSTAVDTIAALRPFGRFPRPPALKKRASYPAVLKKITDVAKMEELGR